MLSTINIVINIIYNSLNDLLRNRKKISGHVPRCIIYSNRAVAVNTDNCALFQNKKY